MDTTNFSLSRWPLKEWGAVLDIRSGRNQREVLDDNGTFPIIGSAGKVMGYANSYLCDEGTTVLGRKGTIDNPLYFEQKFWNVDTAFGLVAGSELEKKFLYYFCLSVDFTKLDKGTTLPSLVKKDLVKVLMPVPGISEQKRIVAILDQAFADMEQARANTEKNLKNAHELFESYLQQVLSQRGEGWAEATLKEVTASVLTGPFGSMLHRSDYVPDGLPLVNPINIRGEIIVPNDSKTVTQETADRLSSYILSEGDLVIARRGEIGRCAVVSLEQDGWVCGTGCFFIKPSNRLSSSYLAHLLRSPKYRDALERVSTGATMKNLSNTSLKNFVVAFPESIDEQLAILNAIDDMKEEISTVEDIYQSKLSALDELKKSILQKAFSGELTKVSKGVAA